MSEIPAGRGSPMKTTLVAAAFIGAYAIADNINNILPGWLIAAGSITIILSIPVALFAIIRKVAR